jgi:hypothetical protein
MIFRNGLAYKHMSKLNDPGKLAKEAPEIDSQMAALAVIINLQWSPMAPLPVLNLAQGKASRHRLMVGSV